MDRQLKQRVVGAGLLVAFGVIFIPIFLDNGGVESPVPPSMNIPPAPTEDVSQRAPALGDDAVAEMEAQADEDVELPPSRVQSGEGSTAEPAPVTTPSASGEPPAPGENQDEGTAVEDAAPVAQDAAEPQAPRMQPPEPRTANPPTAAAPLLAPQHPVPHAEADTPPKPATEARPVAKTVQTKPVAKPLEARPTEPKAAAKLTDGKPVPKPLEPRPASKASEVRADARPPAVPPSKPAEVKAIEARPPPAVKPGPPTVAGWTVQLGSFSSDLNAKKLVDKLKAAGYKAYTEPRLEQGVTVFKVRVGPTPGKAEAERLRQRIEAQFEAHGMLVPSR